MGASQTSNTVTAVIPIVLFQHGISHVLKLTAFSEHLSTDVHDDRSEHSEAPVLKILQNGFMHSPKQSILQHIQNNSPPLKKNVDFQEIGRKT